MNQIIGAVYSSVMPDPVLLSLFYCTVKGQDGDKSVIHHLSSKALFKSLCELAQWCVNTTESDITAGE